MINTYLQEEVLENSHYRHQKTENVLLTFLIITGAVVQDLVTEQLDQVEHLELVESHCKVDRQVHHFHYHHLQPP